jgi:hypothetical protein
MRRGCATSFNPKLSTIAGCGVASESANLAASTPFAQHPIMWNPPIPVSGQVLPTVDFREKPQDSERSSEVARRDARSDRKGQEIVAGSTERVHGHVLIGGLPYDCAVIAAHNWPTGSVTLELLERVGNGERTADFDAHTLLGGRWTGDRHFMTHRRIFVPTAFPRP